MPIHSTNIKSFCEAADSTSNLVLNAYFGLVAIELVLKDAVGLKDHDVPSSLKKFSRLYAVDRLAGCKIRLDSLAVQLKNNLFQIVVQGQDQRPCRLPPASYPYLRYAGLAEDGWPTPVTNADDLIALTETVKHIRLQLRQKFQKDL